MDPRCSPSDSVQAQAAADAWRDFLNDLLTEPMTITELALEWFQIGRNSMALILETMEGVERCGKKVRVPLVKMPPKYLVSRGILPIATNSE